MCLIMIKEPYRRGSLGPLGLLSHEKKIITWGEVSTATGASAGTDIDGAGVLNAT